MVLWVDLGSLLFIQETPPTYTAEDLSLYISQSDPQTNQTETYVIQFT